jgi:Homeobox domain.
LISNGNEYSFSIKNLYESLKRDAIKQDEPEIVNNCLDLVEDFHLEKVIISVSDDRAETWEDIETRKSKEKGRTIVPETTRKFLQQVFLVQPSPNRKDREEIAKYCRLTTLQVRVWVRIIFALICNSQLTNF